MTNDRKKLLIDLLVPDLYDDVSSYITEGKEEDAVKMIEDTVQEGQYDLKEIYGLLLCRAACFGNVKTAEFCKNQGADLDFQDYHGRTPLWFAERFGTIQMIKALKQWGARIDTIETWGRPHRTALNIGESSHELANPTSNQKYKIPRGIAINYFYDNIFSKYFELGIEKEHIRKYIGKRVELLMKDEKLDIKEIYGYFLLFSVRSGDIRIAEFCKDQGADLDFKRRIGETPLWQARLDGNNQMVEALEQWGACGEIGPESSKPYYSHSSALEVKYSSVQDFYRLFLLPSLNNGLSQENLVKTVKDFAQYRGHELQKVYGEILCYAVATDNMEIAEFCKNQGADLNFRDHKGRTPLKIAKKYKHKEMIKTLKEWEEHEKTDKSRSEPSSNLESPSCSNQEKQKVGTKKMCNLM